MAFHVPAETLDYWRKAGSTSATDADIAMLQKHLGQSAPASYVEFMKTYGDVEFDDEINSQFEYIYQEPDRTERRTQLISFVKSPQKSIEYYDGLQKDEQLNLPPHLLPFGMDYGQGELLIEFGQVTERVFYWDFDAHDWETGKTRLGIVADDMYDFINNLQPCDM